MDTIKNAVNSMNIPNDQKVVFGIHKVTRPDLQVIMYVVNIGHWILIHVSLKYTHIIVFDPQLSDCTKYINEVKRVVLNGDSFSVTTRMPTAKPRGSIGKTHSGECVIYYIEMLLGKKTIDMYEFNPQPLKIISIDRNTKNCTGTEVFTQEDFSTIQLPKHEKIVKYNLNGKEHCVLASHLIRYFKEPIIVGVGVATRSGRITAPTGKPRGPLEPLLGMRFSDSDHAWLTREMKKQK